jgi:hypothetical protein
VSFRQACINCIKKYVTIGFRVNQKRITGDTEKTSSTKPEPQRVKEQFKAWRKTKKSPRPIPEKLWAAPVSLTAKHSISQISKELVFDYRALKKRVTIK